MSVKIMYLEIKIKPLVMMTGEDIIHLFGQAVGKNMSQPSKEKRLVNSPSWISKLKNWFGCLIH